MVLGWHLYWITKTKKVFEGRKEVIGQLATSINVRLTDKLG